jgi:hypothetical protein
MNKVIPIVLILGVILLGPAAILFVLNPSTPAAAPDNSPREGAVSISDAPALSAEARGALRDVIQAQGFNCPSVSDGTPTGEHQRGQVIRVRCDNDLQFKVTMRSQGGMMLLVAPWE